MYLDLMSEMAMFTRSFIVVKLDVGILTSSRSPIRFSLEVSIVL